MRVFNAVRHADGAAVGVRVLGSTEWLAMPAATGRLGEVAGADPAGFGVRGALSTGDSLELRTSAARVAQAPLGGRLARGVWTVVPLGDAPVGSGRAVSVLCIDERAAVANARDGQTALGADAPLAGAP